MARHRADDNKDPHKSNVPGLPGETSGDYPAHKPSNLPSKHFNPEEPEDDEDESNSGNHRQPGGFLGIFRKK